MSDSCSLEDLRIRLKALSNRYAVEILQALSPRTGNIVPILGWDEIVDRILINQGISPPSSALKGERTKEQSNYERKKKKIATGGTLYESMERLVRSKFVKAMGEKGKKRRRYMITHNGRLALSAAELIRDPVARNTEMGRAAKILLRYKNFVRLLPAQAKFLDEMGDVTGNLMLQMPPGSGKTFIAMMIILTQLEQGIKCLYLTPLISISRQFISEYEKLLNRLGYSVVRYDAHTDATDEMLERADLIVGIYESVLTAILSGKNWLKKIKLVVVDELTELGSTSRKHTARTLGNDRSCRLDLLITYLKRYAQIITLSSRFGDTDTVAKWLEAEIFRPNVRLVPDEYVVIPQENGVQIFSADGTHHYTSSNKSRLDTIHEYLGNYREKAMLFVVGSRESAEYYAQRIAETYPREIENNVISRILGGEGELPAASRLKKFLQYGVAFHHAGLKTELRGKLEKELKLGNVRCVVSTSGIAAGASFPFDCVTIMFGRSLQGFVNRARYLQIAGRIGEYYLAEHGGTVFIALSRENSDEEQVDVIVQKLLHQPLSPLRPGPVEPYLLSSLVAEEIIRYGRTDEKTVIEQIQKAIRETLLGSIDREYGDNVRKQIEALFKWMEQVGIISADSGEVYVVPDAEHAIREGMNPLDYIGVREKLHEEGSLGESELIESILKFRLVQVSRPRTYIPSKIELQATGLDGIDKWYSEQVRKRQIVKREVIRGWINEKPIKNVIYSAIQQGVGGDERLRRWMNLDEGDMATMVDWAADIAMSLSAYLKKIGKRKRASQFLTFSRRLRYGLKEDAASSDLMTLEVPCDDGPPRLLSRDEIRILLERGYSSIEAIVKRDIDPSKRRPARNRFAKNSGLDPDYAIEVYKAALQRIRPRSTNVS